MTSGRYDDRILATNRNPLYKKYLKDSRGLARIRQYGTPEFSYPSLDNLDHLQITKHTWVLGDRYYKLAYEHYGSSEMWWVIALYNMKPTEAHVKAGDVVYIPKPLEIILQHFMEAADY